MCGGKVVRGRGRFGGDEEVKKGREDLKASGCRGEE
jgi:hypothetical protein